VLYFFKKITPPAKKESLETDPMPHLHLGKKDGKIVTKLFDGQKLFLGVHKFCKILIAQGAVF